MKRKQYIKPLATYDQMESELSLLVVSNTYDGEDSVKLNGETMDNTGDGSDAAARGKSLWDDEDEW